jgi:hypothetical protein
LYGKALNRKQDHDERLPFVCDTGAGFHSFAALQIFVSSARELIEDHADVDFWADRFAEGADLLSPA